MNDTLKELANGYRRMGPKSRPFARTRHCLQSKTSTFGLMPLYYFATPVDGPAMLTPEKRIDSN